MKELNHGKEEISKWFTRRKMEFPDELWNLIKCFQINYMKHHFLKLQTCHAELLKNRPCYLKRFSGAEFVSLRGREYISWREFVKDNKTINASVIQFPDHPIAQLKLYAIEILPRDEYKIYLDDVILYYGWCRDKDRNGSFAPRYKGGLMRFYPDSGYY